ncbi:BTB/POZ domain-containing protein [Rhizophagus irregularis DAOM 181602=DAOM 197198]|nr:BTB/POZ domain-containing protein [Rhizophagus irregularis DAOM 181602=DAOM 197198]
MIIYVCEDEVEIRAHSLAYLYIRSQYFYIQNIIQLSLITLLSSWIEKAPYNECAIFFMISVLAEMEDNPTMDRNNFRTAKVDHINEDYHNRLYIFGPGFGYVCYLFQGNDVVWKSYGSYSYLNFDAP